MIISNHPDACTTNSEILDKNHKVINLNLAIANSCSITNKQVELEQFLISHQVDIFLGTESHLDSSVLNAEVFPNHYNVYRKDRNKYGGGVFIIIRESIPSSQLEITSPNEIIWVQLHTGSYKSVIVGSFYCPPHSPATTWEDLSHSIADVKVKYPNSKIFLGGDFNCPGIDWQMGSLTDSYLPYCLREKLLLLSQEAELEQMVSFPTRGPNMLDLCFTSHPSMVSQCYPIPGLSDHDAVMVKFVTSLVVKQHSRKVFLYKLADWEEIRAKLLTISDKYMELNSKSPRSVDENWLFFRENFLKLIHDSVPVKVISKRTHLPWVNTSLKRLIRKKQRVYNRAKLYSREPDWSDYKSLQKQVSKSLRQQYKDYLNGMLSSKDKKPIWHFIKAKKQDNVNISSLKTVDGQIITDPASKANLLNQYFKTVFTVENETDQPHKGQSLYPTIANFEITTQGVYNILSTCNPHKSPGPDGIHPYALKETATEVSPMLTHIFQQSLSTGTLPALSVETCICLTYL